jgi:two-component system response regulator AtoC
MGQAKLFVVDDDEAARTLLAEALVQEGYEVEAFSSGQAAVERGKQSRADVVLTDIRMVQGDGFLVLKEFKKFSPETSVVLLTAFGSLEGAIEAIKQGAYDYLAKPFKREDIRLVVQRSLEHCRLVRENARFREDARVREPWSQLVGSSPAMLEVYKLVARVSEGRSTVLIEGESGTGKELIARGGPFEQSASREAVHSRELRRAALTICSNRRCSVMRKGRLRERSARRPDCLRPPMAVRCFSMRSAISARPCR